MASEESDVTTDFEEVSDSCTPTEGEMEESLDNYIQRLAKLEQSLGQGNNLPPPPRQLFPLPLYNI